jgi:hypothetical protein
VPDTIAARMMAEWQAGQPVTVDDDVRLLATGVDSLLTQGQLDAAAYAARAMAARYPEHAYPRGVVALLDAMPPATGQPEFIDDQGKDVQIAARPGATDVVLVFCGFNGRMGGPLGLVHRWLAAMPASLVYLRDENRRFYLDGIRSLGPRQDTLAALRGIAASLGARRIACCGNSAGVFGALHYGLELGAAAVVGFAGPTNLDPGFNAHLQLKAWTREAAASGLTAAIDLRAAYAAAARPPQALLVWGSENWDDRLQAEYMAGLPTVRQAQLVGYRGHNVVTTLIRTGRLPAVLEHLVPGT